MYLEALGGVLDALRGRLGGVLTVLENVLEALEVVLEAMLGEGSPQKNQESDNFENHNDKYSFFASHGGVLDILGDSWERLGFAQGFYWHG